MQVVRQRRRNPTVKRRLVIAGATALAVVGTGSGVAYASTRGFGTEQVGQTYHGGLVVSSD